MDAFDTLPSSAIRRAVLSDQRLRYGIVGVNAFAIVSLLVYLGDASGVWVQHPLARFVEGIVAGVLGALVGLLLYRLRRTRAQQRIRASYGLATAPPSPARQRAEQLLRLGVLPAGAGNASAWLVDPDKASTYAQAQALLGEALQQVHASSRATRRLAGPLGTR
jgi:hypothetical protein